MAAAINVGRQIRRLREERGLTQEQLAAALGPVTKRGRLTKSAVAKWEQGATPRPRMMPKIAKVLGVKVGALFGEVG